MKPLAGLLVLLATLFAAHVALAQGAAQTARAGVQPGRIQILGADMAGTCKAEEIERAHRLADSCEGRKQCSFTPQPGDKSSEACARDSMALWDCGDSKTRYAALGPQGAGQSREIRLECPPDAIAKAAPATAPKEAAGVTFEGVPVVLPPASVQVAAKPGTETVLVDSIKILPTLNIVTAPVSVGAIDMSAAGVSRECDRVKQTEWDDINIHGGGPPPHNDRQMLADLHRNIYLPPDHSPDSALRSSQHWGAVRGRAGTPDCFGGQ